MYINIEYDKLKDRGIIKSDFLSNIREHFSEEDESAGVKKAMFKQKRRYIPSRKYIITEQGRFDMGLLTDIIKYLKSLSTPFKMIFSDEFKQRYACGYKFDQESVEHLSFDLRDYQEEGVLKALKNGNGVELVPTAAGKTLMMGSLINTVMKRDPSTKVLLITLTHLIDQIYDEFITYGIDPKKISKWGGDNELDPSSDIVICGTTILYSKINNAELELKKAKTCRNNINKALKNDKLTPEKLEEASTLLGLLDQVTKDITRLEKRVETNIPIHAFLQSRTLLVVDEIHTLKKDNQINNVLKYITTRNRFGFTGTLPESMIDQWNIIGKFGPVIHDVSRDMLVARKYIADTDVRIILLDYKSEPEIYEEDFEETDIDEEFEEADSRYEKELLFIQRSPFRNGIIKQIVEKLEKNTLIVLDRLEHGDLLLSYLTDALPNKKVYFIKGAVENEDREKIKKLMEEEDNIVCIAISRIFSTGINIKNLHYIIFAAAGKAKIKTVQTIGRGVRTLAGKTKVVIFDLADNLHYGKKHVIKRRQVYDNENMQHQTIKIQER